MDARYKRYGIQPRVNESHAEAGGGFRLGLGTAIHQLRDLWILIVVAAYVSILSYLVAHEHITFQPGPQRNILSPLSPLRGDED